MKFECYFGTSLLTGKSKRSTHPLKHSAASSKSGNRTGAGSCEEAPRYTSEKKVCYILALMLILLSMYTVHIVCLENL